MLILYHFLAHELVRVVGLSTRRYILQSVYEYCVLFILIAIYSRTLAPVASFFPIVPELK